MGHVLRGSATTTAAVRRAIQHRQECLSRLAERDDITPKTVAKWTQRTHVDDAPMGPNKPRSTVLSFLPSRKLPVSPFARIHGYRWMIRLLA